MTLFSAFPFGPVGVLDFFEDLGFWLEIGKYAILAYVAWWLFSWAQEKLNFAPLAGTIVGLILIYFLVFEHPILGAFSVLTWILLSGGTLYFLGAIFPWIGGLFFKMRAGGNRPS